MPSDPVTTGFCPKCCNSGWKAFDAEHVAICDACCRHEKGWWPLAIGAENGNEMWVCVAGCGATHPTNPEGRDHAH